MNKTDQETVMGVVDGEGFDYAFCDYSNFEEIKDHGFHIARKEYVKSAKKLKDIIGFNEY